MARCKPIDTSPRFIAVDLRRQLLPGTFKFALNHLIDHALDLKRFDTRYQNDRFGFFSVFSLQLLFGRLRRPSEQSLHLSTSINFRGHLFSRFRREPEVNSPAV